MPVVLSIIILLLFAFISSSLAKVGNWPVIGSIYALEETEMVDCPESMISQVGEPGIYAVTCFVSTLSRERLSSLVEEDIDIGMMTDLGAIESWEGWSTLSDGTWLANVFYKEGTATAVYLNPPRNGSVFVQMFGLD